MSSYYRVILCFHLVAAISWMAGILYLYRLFIYHTEEGEAVVKARFCVMEERLSRIITLPAAIASIVLGIWMIVLAPGLLDERWMWVKLALATLLMGMTHFAGTVRRQLARGETPYTSRTLRILNEVPTLLMIGIIFMVILRPF